MYEFFVAYLAHVGLVAGGLTGLFWLAGWFDQVTEFFNKSRFVMGYLLLAHFLVFTISYVHKAEQRRTRALAARAKERR